MAILDTQVLNGILQDLQQALPSDIRGSGIVSRDGLIMVSTIEDPLYNDKLGAMATALLNSGNDTITELEFGSPWATMSFGNNGGIILREINEDMILAVIVNPGANVGNVLQRVNKTLSDIGE